MVNPYFWVRTISNFYLENFLEDEPVILFINDNTIINCFFNSKCSWNNKDNFLPDFNHDQILSSYKKTWLKYIIKYENDFLNSSDDLQKLFFVLSGFVFAYQYEGNNKYWQKDGCLYRLYDTLIDYSYSKMILHWESNLGNNLKRLNRELFSTRIFNRATDRLGKIACHKILDVGNNNIAKSLIVHGLEMKTEFSESEIFNILETSNDILNSSKEALKKLTVEELDTATYFIKKSVQGIDFERIRNSIGVVGKINLTCTSILIYDRGIRQFKILKALELFQSDLEKVFGLSDCLIFKSVNHEIKIDKRKCYQYEHFGKSRLLVVLDSNVTPDNYVSSCNNFSVIVPEFEEKVEDLLVCQLLNAVGPPRFKIFNGNNIKIDKNGCVFSKKRMDHDTLIEINKKYQINNENYYAYRICNSCEILDKAISIKNTDISIEISGVGDGIRGRISYYEKFPVTISISGFLDFDTVVIRKKMYDDFKEIKQIEIGDDNFNVNFSMKYYDGEYEIQIKKDNSVIELASNYKFTVTNIEKNENLSWADLSSNTDFLTNEIINPNDLINPIWIIPEENNLNQYIKVDFLADLVDTIIRTGFDRSAYNKFSKILRAYFIQNKIVFNETQFKFLLRKILTILDNVSVLDVDFNDLSICNIYKPIWVKSSTGRYIMLGALNKKQTELLDKDTNAIKNYSHYNFTFNEFKYKVEWCSYFYNTDKLTHLKKTIDVDNSMFFSGLHCQNYNHKSWSIALTDDHFKILDQFKRIEIKQTSLFINVNINQKIKKFIWPNFGMESISNQEINLDLSSQNLLLYKIESSVRSIPQSVYVMLESFNNEDNEIMWKYCVYEKADRRWAKWHFLKRLALKYQFANNYGFLMKDTEKEVEYQSRIRDDFRRLTIFNDQNFNFGIPIYLDIPKQIKQMLFICSGRLPKIKKVDGVPYYIYEAVNKEIANRISTMLIGRINIHQNYKRCNQI